MRERFISALENMREEITTLPEYNDLSNMSGLVERLDKAIELAEEGRMCAALEEIS